ncbi:hypothetical protein [Heyndrickxia oleronia]|uniref:hypothetical protein n=1 Tax=Heyndrickxia oleronia TaxID=38875 RepID=UPI001B0E8EAA|nr:hypothetical protein [Heyndrickxia oleronia]GIN41174.1 hypothetical protein J19TS1_41230 [Heyndrickxia oleronia]
MSNILKGRIVNVEKNVHQVTYLLTGIKKKEQWRYGHLPGSNGTVVTGSNYNGTTIDVKIFVYDYNKCVKFDIRDYVLEINDKKKISSKLLDFVVKSNEGKKLVVKEIEGNIHFDFNQLNVKMPKKKK